MAMGGGVVVGGDGWRLGLVTHGTPDALVCMFTNTAGARPEGSTAPCATLAEVTAVRRATRSILRTPPTTAHHQYWEKERMSAPTSANFGQTPRHGLL